MENPLIDRWFGGTPILGNPQISSQYTKVHLLKMKFHHENSEKHIFHMGYIVFCSKHGVYVYITTIGSGHPNIMNGIPCNGF